MVKMEFIYVSSKSLGEIVKAEYVSIYCRNVKEKYVQSIHILKLEKNGKHFTDNIFKFWGKFLYINAIFILVSSLVSIWQ